MASAADPDEQRERATAKVRTALHILDEAAVDADPVDPDVRRLLRTICRDLEAVQSLLQERQLDGVRYTREAHTHDRLAELIDRTPHATSDALRSDAAIGEMEDDEQPQHRQ